MPVKWTRKLIAAEAFESAGVFDVDRDGVLDIVSGAFWYKGPDFTKKVPIADNHRRIDDYYDDFSTIPMDIAGNGRLDVVTGGWWGRQLRWLENPGEAGKLWPQHVLADDIGSIETTRAWDIDGDGKLEIVPNTPGAPQIAFKLSSPGKFSKHILSSNPIGHGYGFGDIDGDGLGELVFNKGYLKPQGDPLKGEWKYVEAFDLGTPDASCPILVVDVNGDGLNDLIVGHSHSYGLDWWEQTRDVGGARRWKKHPIDPFNSQYHDLIWADIDNDGKPELITGKRYRAHCGRDPGEMDDLGIYYFKWTGEGFAKQVIAYGPPGIGAGCGIEFQVADLRKIGRLDIVAPGKDGLHVFFNEGI
jgi:FG-GAP-like repeat